MSFVYPQLLWALSLLIIPIIIHLFNFRKYQTVRFSDVRFLTEVKEETRKRSNLKHILILISRLLALTALILAFTQPYIPTENNIIKDGSSAVSIYIDNSFSMDSEGEDGRFIDMARQMAFEIAEQHGTSTQFQLISNEFSGAQQRLINRDNFFSLLDELEIKGQSRSVPDIYKRQSEILKNSEAQNQIAYQISDFQSGMMTEDIPTDSLSIMNVIWLRSGNRSNAYIDSVWFETPVRKLNSLENLKVRIGNESDSLINVELNREIDGQISSTRVAIQPHAKDIVELKFINKKIGPVGAKLFLTLNPQMRFDDTLYFAYEVLKNIKVMEISNQNDKVFASIFKDDPLFEFSSVSPQQINIETIPQQNLIVLNDLNNISSGLADQLQKFVKNGGSLSVFPGDDIDINAYQRFLSELGTNSYAKVRAISNGVKSYDRSHLFFQDVFESEDPNMNMPSVKQYYPITGTYSSGEEALFTYYNNAPFLSTYSIGSGSVYLSSVPLQEDFSNFVKHGLFVTSVIRMAELSHSSKPLFYTIGSNQYPWIPDAAYNPEINFSFEKDGMSFIPITDRSKEGLITLVNTYGSENNSMINSAGVYDLMYDGRLITKVAFNYPRTESILKFPDNKKEVNTYFSQYNINKLLTQDATQINQVVENIKQNDPQRFWKLCLILALVFLAIEILIIKLWRA